MSFALLSMLLASCGTMQGYEGAKELPANIAVIKSSLLDHFFDTAMIIEIDGTEVGGFQDKVEVLPGEHTVKIHVSSGVGYTQFVGNKTVVLRAVAGRTYKVDGKIRKGEPWAWIVDEATGQLVAGEKP
jgi:hypothetical protein